MTTRNSAVERRRTPRSRWPRATKRSARPACAWPRRSRAEDCQVQSMPDASPTKWHLAHITWFFETFLLERFEARLQAVRRRPSASSSTATTRASASSYPRAQRGLVSRPTLDRGEALSRRRRRAHAGAARARAATSPRSRRWSTLGLQHEQQHQELILTDIKHALAANPLARRLCAGAGRWRAVQPQPMRWFGHEGGLVELGYDAGARRRRSASTTRRRAIAALRRAVRDRVAPGDLRRLPRLHRRRRLPAARALALDGLGLGRSRARAARRSTGARRRPLAQPHPAGHRSRSTRTRRSATSATSRPTPTRAGPAPACRPSSNGSSRRAR